MLPVPADDSRVGCVKSVAGTAFADCRDGSSARGAPGASPTPFGILNASAPSPARPFVAEMSARLPSSSGAGLRFSCEVS